VRLPVIIPTGFGRVQDELGAEESVRLPCRDDARHLPIKGIGINIAGPGLQRICGSFNDFEDIGIISGVANERPPVQTGRLVETRQPSGLFQKVEVMGQGGGRITGQS